MMMNFILVHNLLSLEISFLILFRIRFSDPAVLLQVHLFILSLPMTKGSVCSTVYIK